jgi:hypothetical protein
MQSRYVTNELIDAIVSCAMDFELNELIDQLDAEQGIDSDFNIMPLYDEQGFFYSYDV